MPERTSEAVWSGISKPVTAPSNSAAERASRLFVHVAVRGRQRTNPEELIAAAHAGCYSMAFANGLSKAGFKPTQVHTTAKVHLSKTDAGFSIPQIDLVTEAKVPGIDAAKFKEEAEQAKKNCPIASCWPPPRSRSTPSWSAD